MKLSSGVTSYVVMVNVCVSEEFMTDVMAFEGGAFRKR